MQDSDMFVVVDSVNNLDAVLKREKRYLKNTVIVQYAYRVPNPTLWNMLNTVLTVVYCKKNKTTVIVK